MKRSLKIFSLILLALLFTAQVNAAESVMKKGDTAINAGAGANDVVVAEGNLKVAGPVSGSVFLVKGDALFLPGSVVEGNVTILGGSLWVSKGARVEGEVTVVSGEAHLEEGSELRSEVRQVNAAESLDKEKLDLIGRYIVFDRVVPSSDYNLANLGGLDPDGFRKRHDGEGRPSELDFYELGSLPLSADKVSDSYETDYWGRGMRARVVVIRLTDRASAESVWDEIRDRFEEKSFMSVHNSLADGAHWFFRHRGASYALWMRGDTLVAVMVRHFDDDPERDEWREVETGRDIIIGNLLKEFDSAGANSSGPEQKIVERDRGENE